MSDKLARNIPSELSDSETDDGDDTDFSPSAEMLVHEFDDESTLDEEEGIASGTEDKDELSLLQQEATLSLEDLLSNYSNAADIETTEPVLVGSKPRSSSRRKRKIRDEDYEPYPSSVKKKQASSKVESSEDDEDDEEDEDDDLEEGADNNYLSTVAKEVNVGADYQADIPTGLSKYQDDEDLPYTDPDILMWDPNAVDEHVVSDYLKKYASMKKVVGETAEEGVEDAPIPTDYNELEMFGYFARKSMRDGLQQQNEVRHHYCEQIAKEPPKKKEEEEEKEEEDEDEEEEDEDEEGEDEDEDEEGKGKKKEKEKELDVETLDALYPEAEYDKEDERFSLSTLLTGPQSEEDKALYLLRFTGHDVKEALRRRQLAVQYGLASETSWTIRECKKFELAMTKCGKNLTKVRHKYIPTRTAKEVVAFYYLWKYARVLEEKKLGNDDRFQKLSYIHDPTTTDFMDLLMDEDQIRYSLGPHKVHLLRLIRRTTPSSQHRRRSRRSKRKVCCINSHATCARRPPVCSVTNTPFLQEEEREDPLTPSLAAVSEPLSERNSFCETLRNATDNWAWWNKPLAEFDCQSSTGASVSALTANRHLPVNNDLVSRIDKFNHPCAVDSPGLAEKQSETPSSSIIPKFHRCILNRISNKECSGRDLSAPIIVNNGSDAEYQDADCAKVDVCTNNAQSKCREPTLTFLNHQPFPFCTTASQNALCFQSSTRMVSKNKKVKGKIVPAVVRTEFSPVHPHETASNVGGTTCSVNGTLIDSARNNLSKHQSPAFSADILPFDNEDTTNSVSSKKCFSEFNSFFPSIDSINTAAAAAATVAAAAATTSTAATTATAATDTDTTNTTAAIATSTTAVTSMKKKNTSPSSQFLKLKCDQATRNKRNKIASSSCKFIKHSDIGRCVLGNNPLKMGNNTRKNKTVAQESIVGRFKKYSCSSKKVTAMKVQQEHGKSRIKPRTGVKPQSDKFRCSGPITRNSAKLQQRPTRERKARYRCLACQKCF